MSHEGMIGFLSGRAEAWATMVGSASMLCAVAFLGLLALISLARRGWRPTWPRRLIESVFCTLTIFHVNFLFLPFVALAADAMAKLYALAGIPSVPASVWSGLPAPLLAGIALLAYDFANYWNHRLLHSSWFWPVHAVHHSDPEVNGLTAYRVHALEAVVMWGSYVVMLTWLGLPSDALGLGAILLALHNIYVHVNIDWDHGPARLLIASPRFHRWHHADDPAAYGKNLANMFPFLDKAFGTYYVPGRCEAEMGAEGVPRNDVARLLLFPFTAWAAMISRRLRGLRGPKAASWPDPASAAAAPPLDR